MTTVRTRAKRAGWCRRTQRSFGTVKPSSARFFTARRRPAIPCRRSSIARHASVVRPSHHRIAGPTKRLSQLGILFRPTWPRRVHRIAALGRREEAEAVRGMRGRIVPAYSATRYRPARGLRGPRSCHGRWRRRFQWGSKRAFPVPSRSRALPPRGPVRRRDVLFESTARAEASRCHIKGLLARQRGVTCFA